LFTQFRNTQVPCLLVYGQNDPSISVHPAEADAMLSLHMHLVNLEGSGHFPMIDDTARFNRLLVDFLALDSGLSPRELELKEEWKRRMR